MECIQTFAGASLRSRMKEIGWLTPALVLLLCSGPAVVVAAWGQSSDSVHLKDVEVLTLYAGKMTNGRRSSPVPQLECIRGGTAPCDAFNPRVVQCYNRGFDGVDVQWECKTDMDNAFRFGNIEVSCEGYNNRDDPYVLKGSCGLRYSLDYTKEGLNNQEKTHNYYPNQNQHSGSNYGWSYQNQGKEKLSSASYFADLIVYVAIGLMCYAFYKTCIGSNRQQGQDAYSTTNNDYPAGGGGGGYGWFGGNTHPTAPPPPAGFHPGYTDDASCHRNRTGHGGNGGGFWTGAVTGGLLGYMFGNRGGQQNYANRRGGGWGSGGSGFSGGGGFSGGFGGGGSTGTRTASGFGGTSRR